MNPVVVDAITMDKATLAGAAIYTMPTLWIYDFFVLGICNRWAWKCPTQEILNLYNEHIGARHLDVGVGTGYFLDRCRFPVHKPFLALVDLNPSSLRVAAKRLERYQPLVHQANVVEPLTLNWGLFDTIGINYLLHCLPGDWSNKGKAIQHLRSLLKENGVVFGATLLGVGVEKNKLARLLTKVYNMRGIFNNATDDLVSLEGMLKANFRKSSVRVVGCAAFFIGWA